MATSRRKEGEVLAVGYNQKEQRLLEKSLATLRRQQSYSLKLLDLHNRTVKVRFRQLKDKVSRIKSYLTAEEINECRTLEAEGKLGPTCPPVFLGNAMKIAAAARRLNNSFKSEIPTRRVKSANPCIHVSTPSSNSTNINRLLSPERRRNSVSGAFIDMPVPQDVRRPGSAQEVQRGRPVTSIPKFKISVATVNRPSTGLRSRCVVGEPSTDFHSNVVNFPIKSTGNLTVNSEIDKVRGLSRSSYHTAHSHARAPFSSHVVTEKEAREKADAEKDSTSNSQAVTERSFIMLERRTSYLPRKETDEMEEALGEDLHAERRAHLFKEELIRIADIVHRKKLFLKELERYLRDHPPVVTNSPKKPTLSHPPSPDEISEEKETFIEEKDDTDYRMLLRRRKDQHVDFDVTPTFLPEEDYRERLMGLWRDMNRCRYLRVPDELIDLSGVNTLAADQMKMHQILRQKRLEPLANAWRE